MNLQVIAITCYGNASLSGFEVPEMFPDSWTLRNYESVSFQSERKIFTNPNDWFAELQSNKCLGLRLHHGTRDGAPVDPSAAGYLNGDGIWVLEAVMPNNMSDLWSGPIQLLQNALQTQRRLKICYQRYTTEATGPYGHRSVTDVSRDLKAILEEIIPFSEKYTSGDFTDYFKRSLDLLGRRQFDPEEYIAYAPPELLSPASISLLLSATRCFVFGGMGSWNEMCPPGEPAVEYKRLSQSLFDLIMESGEVAASSSFRKQAS